MDEEEVDDTHEMNDENGKNGIRYLYDALALYRLFIVGPEQHDTRWCTVDIRSESFLDDGSFREEVGG